jgi:limonene-1,2-epoxide hydrolase
MRWAAILGAAVVLAGCGDREPRSPESVARAWSAAIDRADDDAAASLFADDANVIQSGILTLRTHADAVQWNAALPCGGRVTRVVKRPGHEVLLVFRLRDRPGHRCDAPGSAAAAIFRVENGKIVLWHQTDVPRSSPSEPAI